MVVTRRSALLAGLGLAVSGALAACGQKAEAAFPWAVGAAPTLAFNSNTHFAVLGDSLTALGFYDDYYNQAVAHFGGGFTGSYLNAGIGGTNAQDQAARVVSAIVNASPKPTLVFVADGRNDTAFTNAQLTMYYSWILNSLRAGGISNVLCVSSWLSQESAEPNGTLPGTLDQINLREQECAIAAGNSYLDIRTIARAWEAINNTGNVASGILTVDGTHPNATGKLWVTPYLQAAVPYV